MKKWISSTVILLSSVCLPLSLIGSETLDWGIIGIGGYNTIKENERSLKINPLMAAAARRAATAKKAGQVDQVTNVTDDGIIQPVVDSGAGFASIFVNGYPTTTIDFPSIGSPEAYVTQTVPEDFDIKKDATVIFTLITTSSLLPITGNATFNLTLNHRGGFVKSRSHILLGVSSTEPVTSGNAQVNTYKLTLPFLRRLPAQFLEMVLQLLLP